MSRVTALVLALALLVGLGVSTAAAARLDVTAVGTSLTHEERCAAAMANSSPVINTASFGATTVGVENVPLACSGLPLRVSLHNASGDLIASGATASAGTSQAVEVGPYAAQDVVAAIATIDGWIFPTDWVIAVIGGTFCEGIDEDGNVVSSCELTLKPIESWPQHDPYITKVHFKAVTDAPLWRITLDLGDTALFHGIEPTVIINVNNVAKAPNFDCASLPIFVGVEANPSWNSAEGEIQFSSDPNFGAYADILCPAP